MSEVIVDGIAGFIFAAIIGTTQLALVAYQWHTRRDKTKAEATQITANSFDTLTKTITTMATDFSATLMKTIELVNSREKRIDELEVDNRQKTSDLKELRDQLSDMTNVNVQRDNKIELLQASLDTLTTANANQANEIVQLQVRILKLQDENREKEQTLAESKRQISVKDERIRQLEERVKHLEEEIKELKKPVPPPTEEKTVEAIVVEVKTEDTNPS